MASFTELIKQYNIHTGDPKNDRTIATLAHRFEGNQRSAYNSANRLRQTGFDPSSSLARAQEAGNKLSLIKSGQYSSFLTTDKTMSNPATMAQPTSGSMVTQAAVITKSNSSIANISKNNQGGFLNLPIMLILAYLLFKGGI